ncbi:MAG: AhpC/TSA family protein [Chitinophagaceae bacterium]|nr:AhpC/TSA family protein [Chitinophagaceae bacterium]
MKYVLLLSLSLLLGFSTSTLAQKKNLQIKINVADADSGRLILGTLSDNKYDTLKFRNHQCVFSRKIDEAGPMVISDEQRQYKIFFVDPGSTMELDLTLASMNLTRVSGSASNDIMTQLNVAQEPYHLAARDIQQKMQQPGANMDSLNQLIQLINVELKRTFRKHLADHADLEAMAFLVYSSMANDRNLNIGFADSLINTLQGKAKTCYYGQECIKLLSKQKAVTKGYKAPDFTLKDSSGKAYTLSKLKSKYILIDFWASWCGPCKAEIPHMKQAYAKYHSKGFEILSVSIDAKEDAWRQALRQFQMPWIHVLDIRGQKGSTMDLYHTPSIPKTLLIDAQGMIIDTDLRGPMLEQRLSELLHD